LTKNRSRKTDPQLEISRFFFEKKKFEKIDGDRRFRGRLIVDITNPIEFGGRKKTSKKMTGIDVSWVGLTSIVGFGPNSGVKIFARVITLTLTLTLGRVT
jgi:hypothetical protein